MKEFWNSRYGSETYVYGIQPNEFFKKALTELDTKGDILLPAEGEGRNAVFAAQSGWRVVAFDISEEGKKKALRLAGQNNMKIEYLVGDLNELNLEENSFDVLALIYAHFPAEEKSELHKKLASLLKTGGTIIFEGFSKKQFDYQKINPEAGGPKNIDMLFSIDEIKRDFPDFETLKLSEEDVELNEGTYHIGKNSVIRFVGRKTPPGFNQP